MTYEMYHNIFMICAAAGGVMAFVSILLFVLLKIPSVIGDLTGATARKGIAQIRNGNTQAALSYKKRKKQKHQGYGMNTEKLKGAAEADRGETEKLQAVPEALGGETALLSQDVGSTTLSPMPASETTVLQPYLEVLEDITILHTEEEIEGGI